MAGFCVCDILVGMWTSVAINEPTRTRFIKKLRMARSFLPPRATVHVDISDGVWTPVTAVVCRSGVRKYGGGFVFAGHLMLPWKKLIAAKWYDGTFRTVYVHAREVKDWNAVRAAAANRRIRIGAVVRAGETQKNIASIPLWVKTFLVLAVVPGKSGQRFDKKALATVRILKKKRPRATIAVDGGINRKTALVCKKAGADEVVSASYIWTSVDPAKAYRALREI